jgi:predicted dehydrogenase
MIRIGIIGAGPNGKGHVKAFLEKHSSRCAITGIADVNLDAAKAAAEPLAAKAVARAEELFGLCDMVVVSSPNFLHCEQAVAAANAGKHVWVEKPMALSVVEADRIVAAVQSAKVKSMVGFSVRFGNVPRTLAAKYRSGELGELLSIWSRRVAGFGAKRSQSWRGQFAKSGGVMSELIAHEIDWMVDIAGMPTSVYCRVTSLAHDDPRANDHLWMTLSFDKEVTGTIEGSQMAPISDYYKGICGRDKSVYDQKWGQEAWIQHARDKAEPMPLLETFDKHGHFLDVIEERCESVASVEWGRKIVAISEKALESAVRGQAVAVEGL